MKTKIIFILVLLCIWLNAAGQSGTPYLERVLTISFDNERLDAALKKISQQAGFTFSYSPSILEADRIVTYSFVNKTVREILDQLFSGTVQYKARGKYLILTKAIARAKETQVYSGYIVDESTGQRLRDVTVYDPVSLQSAVTDQFGFFQIKIDKPPDDLRLAINKQNYSDTLIVPSRSGRLLNIPMKVDKERFAKFADSVQSKMKRFWTKTKLFAKPQALLENVEDTIHRTSQISFVPFIGTNHALSGNVINDYSFNVIGGFSRGVRKVELGGVFNIVTGDVRGVQFSGTFNAVGGSVRGGQFAGIFNANRGNVDGGQLAGVFNFNWGQVEKFSAAGVFNFARSGSDAVQLAGVGNLTVGDQSKPHLAGVYNLTTGNAKTQVAGAYNMTARNLRGWQGAGILNFAGGNVHGVQTAGILNFAAREVRGAQVAGVLNYATKVRGVQIGLINVSDSARGVPIGLFSVVMKGYHKIEFSADEIFYTNLAFRTGVRQFYNILTAGIKTQSLEGDTATHWTFGYGVGTAPRLSKKLFLNIDITSNQIMQGSSFENLNMLNKAYLGIDYQFARKMSLTFGATLNAHLTDRTRDGYWSLFPNLQPRIFHDQDIGNTTNMKMWFGGKVGVRFL
ncbi:MAG TPA: STN domain-containing protein [Chryseosolibacter sp.]